MSPPYVSRKSRTLKVTTSVVELAKVVLPSLRNPHQCYVEYPVPSGPQPCLIVEKHPNGHEDWKHALIVTPNDAPHSREFEHRAYAAALGLIRAAYSPAIKAIPENAIAALLDASFEDHPYLHQDYAEFTSAIRDLTYGKNAPRLSAQQLVTALRDNLDAHLNPAATRWTPLILTSGKTPAEFNDNWKILQAWERWEKHKFTLPQCLEDFSTVVPGKQKLDAFRKRLAYMGLHAADKLSHRKLRSKR